MNDAPPAPAFSNLSDVLRALRGLVGCWHLQGWLSAALMVLLHRRLAEIGRRMERMAARFEAGRLWRRKPAPPAAMHSAMQSAPPAAPAATAVRTVGAGRTIRIWPGQWAWLVRAAGWQAAGYGLQLQAILGTPEMVALLRAAPQAGRVLRPVCRMLGVDWRLLRPQADGSPAAAAIARDRAPRARPPSGPAQRARIALPRGVLSAARRQGFAKR